MRVVLQVKPNADEGESVMLTRPTIDPDDVADMVVASAIITEISGSTSHPPWSVASSGRRAWAAGRSPRRR
ncbi:PEP-utilizing enzyme [Georgenia ruanii]|uniref:PEP-utilizing enzyme n=1 Tax=Georgenia ruanii TaxID=348442 RepID=UPI001D00352B